MCASSTTKNDDCDEELDEPTAEEIARQYVREHGRIEPDQPTST